MSDSFNVGELATGFDTGGGRISSLGGGAADPAETRRRLLAGTSLTPDAVSRRLNDAAFNPQPYQTLDDVKTEWATVPEEIRVRLKAEMLAIGLINPDPTRTKAFLPNDASADPATLDALKIVFQTANSNNEHWSKAYRRFVNAYTSGVDVAAMMSGGSGGGGGGGGGGAARPVFRAPDPATLRETIRESVKNLTGREVQDAEMADLLEPLARSFRDQFNSSVSGGQQVDPAARFNELLRDKYETELSLVEERDEFAQTSAVAQANMNFVDRLAMGGAL